MYPIKSCRGVSVPSLRLDEHGVLLDRRFVIVDAEGKIVTLVRRDDVFDSFRIVIISSLFFLFRSLIFIGSLNLLHSTI